jgi:glycosyltransferase involved in cell wall biosynthesis
VALVVAGNPTAHTAEIEKKIAALTPDEQKRIHLIKGFSETDKSAIFDAAGVFVSVSPYESFGIVFLEAWMAQLPVIGCRRGGSAKIITNFQDGLLVDFGKPRELAGAILELLENKNVACRMGENGYRKVQENFTWDRIVDRWEKLYLAVARPDCTVASLSPRSVAENGAATGHSISLEEIDNRCR